MDVGEIIEKYLKENGFDGLSNEDCGCGIDDLIPCANLLEDCEAAYYCEARHGFYPDKLDKNKLEPRMNNREEMEARRLDALEGEEEERKLNPDEKKID